MIRKSTPDLAQYERAASERRGGLLVLDHTGEPLHVAPPAATAGLRYLLARVHSANDRGLPPRLAVTAALSGEGVTFVARCLGAVIAHDLRRSVCIVETNWWSRGPSRGRKQEAPVARPGLSDVIGKEHALDDVIIRTNDPNLAFVPAGHAEPSHRPILARSEEVERVLERISERYEHIVIDLPPVISVSETITLAEHADSYALVVRQRVTTASQVKRAMHELDGIAPLGVVLNRSTSRVSKRLLDALSSW